MAIKVADKQWVDSWELMGRQVSQADAEYNSIGMIPGEKACANCRWFVESNACILVAGEINPTGLSKYWEKEPVYEVPPMPVVIVDGESDAKEGEGNKENGGLVADAKSSISKIAARVIAFATGGNIYSVHPAASAPSFSVKEMEDGSLRFFATFTNCFEDAEGDIFPVRGHKEFVGWADSHKSYPELWVWHTPGTKYGQVDWMDVSDGIVVASGLIDSGKEQLARDIANTPDMGMSHGYLYAEKSDNGTIEWYRSYEISTLPRAKAANKYTGFDLLNGELEMAFSDAKKEHLRTVLKVDDATITQMEKDSEALSANLKQLGISWKEEADTEVASLDGIDAKVTAIAAAVGGLAAKITEVETTAVKAATDAESASKSLDDKVAEAFEARTKQTAGVAASQSDENVVQGEKAKEVKDWFGPQMQIIERMVS